MSDQMSNKGKKKTITLKGLSDKQKDALIAGGLSLSAVGMGLGLFKLLGSKHRQPTRVASASKEVDASNETETFEDLNVAEETYAYEAEVEATATYTFDSDVSISFAADDGMSFDEAFQAARQDTGAGGFFNYQGETYSTFYKEEWEGMSVENQNDFFTQVSEKTTFDTYVEHNVVEDYEVVELADDDFFDELESSSTTSQSRDIVDVASIETKTASEDLVEGDDFFNDLSTEANDRNTSDLTTSTVNEQEDLISQDDFFSDLSEESEDSALIDEAVVVVRPVFGLDSNSDDVIDMVAIDQNQDGIADVVALDEDFDGNYESFMINEDGGENLDVFVVDQGLDGIDPNDSRESIDDIISMDDFIILEDEDVESIENMEMIENLVDGTEDMTETNENSEDSLDNDFDEIGL